MGLESPTSPGTPVHKRSHQKPGHLGGAGRVYGKPLAQGGERGLTTRIITSYSQSSELRFGNHWLRRVQLLNATKREIPVAFTHRAAPGLVDFPGDTMPTAPTIPEDVLFLRRFRMALLRWCNHCRRDLPWRWTATRIASGFRKSCCNRPGWRPSFGHCPLFAEVSRRAAFGAAGGERDGRLERAGLLPAGGAHARRRPPDRARR